MCDAAGPVPIRDVVAALRGSVTFIGPTDSLVVRVPWDISAEVFTEYASRLAEVAEANGWTGRILVLPAEQIAVLAEGEDGDL